MTLADGTPPHPLGGGLTREGKVSALLFVGFTLGALNTGTNLLYLLTAVVGAALLLNLWAARRLVSSLAVEGQGPVRVTQGERPRVALEVRALRALVAPVRLELGEDEDTGAGVVLLPLAAGEVARASIEAPVARRRGRLRLGDARVVATAPFGLFRRVGHRPLGAETLVVPPVRALRAGALSQRAPDAEGIARRPTLAPEERDVVRGVRDLRPGDDVRAIHWRASARRGAPVVKEFERPAPRDATVVLHLGGAGGAAPPPELQDAAACLAASIVVDRGRAGDRVALVLTGGPDGATSLAPAAGPSAAARALDLLALAGPADESELARAGQAAAAWGGARLFVVTTGDPGAARRVGPLARGQLLAVRSPADVDAWLEAPPALVGGGAS